MNLSLFIARKIAFSKGKKSFSAIIIRIAIAAIAISVSVMILTSAIIDGFKAGISEKIFGFWGHINISHVGVKSNIDNLPLPAKPDYYHILDTLGKIPYYPNESAAKRMNEKLTKGGIDYIQSYALLPGIIKTKESLEGIILKGAGDDFRWDKLGKYIVEGRVPDFNSEAASDEILISGITSNRLELKPDDQIIIHFIQGVEQLRRRFTVVGIYDTGLEEYDSKTALVDIRKITQILEWSPQEVGGFEVFLEDISDMDVFNEYIYLELLPGEAFSETIKRKFPGIFDWLEFTALNERVIFLLMCIVSIINMVTALLIFILERTNMIGVLNALGMTHFNLRKVFLYHAAYIIVFGLLIGNIIGISLGWLQSEFEFIKLDEANYYLSVAPIKFSFIKILLINVVTLIIILLSLILPSLMISRIDPVRAIKFS
jgi:lipoprotein-releasing system permease protein